MDGLFTARERHHSGRDQIEMLSRKLGIDHRQLNTLPMRAGGWLTAFVGGLATFSTAIVVTQ